MCVGMGEEGLRGKGGKVVKGFGGQKEDLVINVLGARNPVDVLPGVGLQRF